MLTLEKFSCTKINTNLISFSIYACSIIKASSTNQKNINRFLRTIAGLSKPKKGKITWVKNNILKNTLYIKDILGLYNTMTVMDHIQYWAKIYGTNETIPSAIKYFKLKNILHCKPKELTYSQCKQILLSKTLIYPVDIWIFDAPFKYLDKDIITLFTMIIHTKCSNGGIIFIGNTDNIKYNWHLQINLDNNEIFINN